MPTQKSPIAEVVRRRMYELDIHTFADLERRAGVPKDTVRNLMNGRSRQPRPESLRGIARALEVSVSELYGERPAVDLASLVECHLHRAESPAEPAGSIYLDPAALQAFAAGVDVRKPVAVSGARGKIDIADRAVTSFAGDGSYVLASPAGTWTVARLRSHIADAKLDVFDGEDSPPTTIDPKRLNFIGRVVGTYQPA